jgi:hypothetical protein
MSSNLIITFCLVHICKAGILNSPEVKTPLPTPIPDPESLRGGCEYDGDYYEPGVIHKEVFGACESVITCEEGGGVIVSDSAGCFYDPTKGKLLRMIFGWLLFNVALEILPLVFIKVCIQT